MAALLPACSDRDCTNHLLDTHMSPGSELKAVVFQRMCAGSSPANTQISILPAGATLRNRGGNVFAAEAEPGSGAGGTYGGPEVSVEWAGRNRLRITYDGQARVRKQEDREAAVVIEYSKSQGQKPDS